MYRKYKYLWIKVLLHIVLLHYVSNTIIKERYIFIKGISINNLHTCDSYNCINLLIDLLLFIFVMLFEKTI